MTKNDLVMLVIMDGFGIRKETDGNAIAAANKPNLDYLMKRYPNTTIEASGEPVGLPDGQMGNSEVGHMNIGAGRVVFQSLTRVNIACRDDSLISMPAIDKAVQHAIATGGDMHIMGLCSDGGVHSHLDHIIYLANRSLEKGVKRVFVHAWLDGRDVPPQSAKGYLATLKDSLHKGASIGVVSGRYYAMDRDKNYDRVQLAYDALVYGKAPIKELQKGMDESYAEGVTDEFVVPYIVDKDAKIKDGDSVIYANFRPDRAIEMSVALTNPDFANGPKGALQNAYHFKDLCLVQMMLYSDLVKGDVAFGLQELNNMYGDVIADAGLTQLRIAETEKYAHVTYFFDGGVDKELKGATRILVPSPKVATYDLKPEMSAYEVRDKVLEAIYSKAFNTIILNFANCDMVGHTAVFDAAVKAVETVDKCVGDIYKAVEAVNGTLIIIADHGNADMIWDEEKKPFSAHTTNPVPFIITREDVEIHETGSLCDVTPTMLQLLEITQPKEMTGKSMIKRFK